MKALRWHGRRDIRLEQIGKPLVQPGKVVVKVAFCGICGSDIHEYVGGPITIPVNNPHPITQEKAPLVLGHEFSGTVIEVGEGVKRVKVGDRVVVEPTLSCGECEACLIRKYNNCSKLGFQGLSGGGGGMSEFTLVDENRTHKLPDELSFEQGALVEPAAVALHAVRTRSKIKVGDKAVIFGAGPIGLLLIDALKLAGASEIYVVQRSAVRRKKAQELGAIVLDPMEYDVVEEIRRRTNGGADVSFEATGVPEVLQQAIDSTKFEGEIIIVSLFEKEASINTNHLVIGERSLKGSAVSQDLFPLVMEFMKKGFFSAENLVTKQIQLDDVIQMGFEALLNDKSHVKILVKIE